MNNLKTFAIITSLSLILAACTGNKPSFDASGSFEAEEIIISAEANGIIKQFDIEEGQSLEAGQAIGYIDSIQLHLKKRQLQAQIRAILSKKPNIKTQTSSLEQQLETARTERNRIANLVKGDAATPKQLDDINAQIKVLEKQIKAQKSTLSISNRALDKNAVPLQIQIEQLNDLLDKCTIINPVNGTVLTKYAQINEMAATGKPLYKIADLSNIILRVYITNDQLAQVKLNQNVKVFTDDGQGTYKETNGTIIWINNKAEFTPKTVQTKKERADLVYAVKVKVPNDGYYKIGMYGEINFE